MAGRTHYDIPLFDVGTEGAGFRLQNTANELQRPHIDQYRSSDVKYQADIFAVIHGTITPGGQHGLLLVTDFKFTSIPQKRRFKRVEISIAFGRENKAVGGPNEPSVRQFAPCGAFSMDETTQNRVDTVEANVTLEGGFSLATLGIGSSFQRVTTTDIKSYAILNGMSWIEGRNEGAKNAVHWDITENRKSKFGVPSHVRTAILLELPDEARFRAELQVTADIGTFHQKVKRKVGARTGLDPVIFDPSEDQRFNIGPTLHDVDKGNLSACNLDELGSAKVPSAKVIRSDKNT
ncbi:uncharacterized protein GGS22DRAFT_158882 [Annulohypoxylon maeteangense]|uniref:uncharacterized protein n=1 Tax=Annulohypoxylon maeteangense TaxID=1927788 RepID=UPI0020075EBD|nr:uncharacterized protein GGS22DRAFT_158882 [Annulohypoxylon maeteangense]KAI0886864.1 hypothetical protein GGS22DRAFT_158882 [Annulohypoxylon maeteangense]